MTDLVDELSRKARALPPEDRVRLAEELFVGCRDLTGESGGEGQHLRRGRHRQQHLVFVAVIGQVANLHALGQRPFNRARRCHARHT